LDTSIQSPRHEAFYTAISKDRWEQINRYFHIWKLTQPTELTELAEPIRLANPDQKATPLHVAAFNGNGATVSRLLKGRADVASTNPNEATALQNAAYGGRERVVKNNLETWGRCYSDDDKIRDCALACEKPSAWRRRATFEAA
jgi:ankyrin repeat protein